MIPISKVDVQDSEDLVLSVLRSGLLAQGPMVARLEDEFAAAIGVRHCIAVNNGTTALVAALNLFDLEEGDEVITSPFTFVATINAVLEAGGSVRFADINEDDFCLNVDSVASRINNRTRVIMPVHLYGQCADMHGLTSLSERERIPLVEDAAQAHGATFEGKSAGTFGVGCFSLYATKNLTSGEGGLITTNNDAQAQRLRVMRNQGMRERYKYEMIGHNYRLTDIHAAVAIPQVAKMQKIADQRSENAARLNEGLSHLPGLRLPRQLISRRHVWHQYTVILTQSATVSRDEFIARMAELGVGCGAYYPKLAFDYDCFKEDRRVKLDDVKVAERTPHNFGD
jgi:dTDP-4-amino-4,6-dideoxygalactose transaminase